jgi:hypothetical protein
MSTNDPFLLTLHLTTCFGELMGMLWSEIDDADLRGGALSRLVESAERWWEVTRPTPSLDPPLPMDLPEANTLREAANALVDPFGDALAERLAGPLSPAGASRLTVASHVGGLAIHLWRHWGNLYEMRCIAELADRIPAEFVLCAIGSRETVPASALHGYVPKSPDFSLRAAHPIRIGWDTGHHVAFLCAKRGWFG